MKSALANIVIFACTIVTPAFGNPIEMSCSHSFQGNYSGGDALLRYEYNSGSRDKAFIKVKSEWIEICTDVETHGPIEVSDFMVSCSIYLANWMNSRRKDFLWDFENKALYVQTLSKKLNPYTNRREWEWRYSVGEIGTKDWKVLTGWESDGVVYDKRKCK